MADQIKTVAVSLSPAEESALSRPTRRRRRKFAGGGENEIESPAVIREQNIVGTPTTVPTTVPTAAAPPAPAVPPAPAAAAAAAPLIVPTPRLNAPPLNLPLPTAVKVIPKKVVPKIIASKRKIGGAVNTSANLETPSNNHTYKKPKFIMGGTGLQKVTAPTVQKSAQVPTRKYKARKVKLTLTSSVKTRKTRRDLKGNVAALPIEKVKEALLKKGLIKSLKTTTPPAMLRALLLDFYLLHAAE